jgi:hypothetical protein
MVLAHVMIMILPFVSPLHSQGSGPRNIQSTVEDRDSFACTTLCPGYFCPSSCPSRGDPEPGVGERTHDRAQESDGPDVYEAHRSKKRDIRPGTEK